MLPSAAESIQALAVIYKALWVDNPAVLWWKVWPSRKPLFLTLVTIQHLLSLDTPLLHALFVRPEGTTLVTLEPEVVPKGLTMCFEVASDRKAVLGITMIPPSLARADARLPTLVCSDAVCIRLTTAAYLLGFRRHSTNIMFVIPTKDTELWHNCWQAHFQREEPLTTRGLFCGVATKLRCTLSVVVTLLPNFPLLPTILNPIGILPTSGIHRAVVTNVRAVIVSATGVILIVWLQRLARAT